MRGIPRHTLVVGTFPSASALTLWADRFRHNVSEGSRRLGATNIYAT